MQETSYKIYLYPRWFIINAAASLALTIGCALAISFVPGTEWKFAFFFLAATFAGLMIINLLPLFSIRKPCINCTAAGMVIYLKLQPDQRNDRDYFRTLHEFIPWENVHGIYLAQKRQWSKRQPLTILRINYSVIRTGRPAFSHVDIFVHQLNVHPKSMYNTLMAYYSKYKPVNH